MRVLRREQSAGKESWVDLVVLDDGKSETPGTVTSWRSTPRLDPTQGHRDLYRLTDGACAARRVWADREPCSAPGATQRLGLEAFAKQFCLEIASI
jgi:hypothetical protein